MPSVAQEKAITVAAARAHGLDPKILWGVFGTESAFGRNQGPSSAGAVGWMQFEPSTARSLGVNPYDFKSAMFGAAKYLSQYKSRGLAGMLSAYNAGPAGALQPAYVSSVLKNAATFGSVPGGGVAGMTAPGGKGRGTSNPARFGYNVSMSGGKPDTMSAGIASLLEGASRPISSSGTFKPDNLLNGLVNNIASGQFVTPMEPKLNRYKIPGTGTGGQALMAAGHGQTLKGSSLAGGFLPANAHYAPGRKDQGRDGTTNPGGAIIAPGDGYVVRVASDPNGFGPRYPIVHFTSGPFAGKTIYIGHTLSVVGPGAHFHRGQVLSHTGTHGVGNATVPGWFEIGYAGGGTPGPWGQATPF